MSDKNCIKLNIDGAIGFFPIGYIEKAVYNYIPERVLSGKGQDFTEADYHGIRDTRYKCPKCKKNLRNNETYCHKCGKAVIFPDVSFTPYVEGEKQKIILKWSDEQ